MDLNCYTQVLCQMPDDAFPGEAAAAAGKESVRGPGPITQDWATSAPATSTSALKQPQPLQLNSPTELGRWRWSSLGTPDYVTCLLFWRGQS